VLHYASETAPVQRIAKELNVGTIMQGSIRYIDERAHLIVELVAADTGLQLWTADYEGTDVDIFSIRNDMTEKVASALGKRLSVDELARMGQLPTRSADAYTFYMRAMDEFSKDTFGSRITAQTFLDQAIALDSDFAHAYAGKALIYAYAAINSPDSNSELPPDAADRVQLVRDYATSALAINPDTDLAHYALGVLGMFSRNWSAAGDSFERAITLAPQDAGFLAQYAWFLACALEEPDGLRYAERAATLDPQNPRVHELKSRVHDCMDDNRAAFTSIERSLELDPTAFGRRFDRAMLAPHIFEPDACAQLLRDLEPLLTDQRFLYLPPIALTYAELGYDDDARRVFERFSLLSEDRKTGPANWVTAYLAIGETDLAFNALQQATNDFALGPGFRTLLSIRINLRQMAILDEPRFAVLREQLGSLD
jgi:Tfp pilus assembly protein PilF